MSYIGPIGIQIPFNPLGANIAVGTSAASLSAISSTNGFNLKADHQNTGNIFLGVDPTTLSTANAYYRLNPGESVFVCVKDLSRLAAVANASNCKLYVIGG